jgi:hypothetical protein
MSSKQADKDKENELDEAGYELTVNRMNQCPMHAIKGFSIGSEMSLLSGRHQVMKPRNPYGKGPS